MCMLVILSRPGHDWPLILAGNRDEMQDRPTAAPARHWQSRPQVVAGLDRLAGGSWWGINDDGLVAVVMNREGTLGPDTGKRSRGELVLEALDHAESTSVAEALSELNPTAYRAFNLFVADARHAYWLRHAQTGRIIVETLPPGLHMLSSGELDDRQQPRIQANLPRFLEAQPPDPGAGRWEAWRSLLASREDTAGAGPSRSMNLRLSNGFGTLSSGLMALPADPGIRPIWLFADGAPDKTPFNAVDLEPGARISGGLH